MKILHTADWHLGIKLHKKDLSEDHRLFFEWLIELIKDKKIDILLISGDIFDQANPTNEARQLYYSFLKQLILLKCKVVITGGNHDSPGILNAPKEILKMLEIHIIGSVPEKIENEIVEIKNKNGNLVVVICAVPYLRDSDIRVATEGESYETRIEQTRSGIKKHYEKIAELCKEYGENIPIICMGHLFATGVSVSESEREIQIGNLASFNAIDFPKIFSYIALGHIHKPQQITGNKFIRYSGSPISLSFSEKEDKKMVIEIELMDDNTLLLTEYFIPVHRILKKFSGSLEQINKEVKAFKNVYDLKAFAELEIIEENNDPIIQTKINQLLGDFQSEEIEILKYKLIIKNQVLDSSSIFDATTNIEDLNPSDIIKKRLEIENISEEQKVLILEAFSELFQLVQENQIE